jgi:hypothetical protein
MISLIASVVFFLFISVILNTKKNRGVGTLGKSATNMVNKVPYNIFMKLSKIDSYFIKYASDLKNIIKRK